MIFWAIIWVEFCLHIGSMRCYETDISISFALNIIIPLPSALKGNIAVIFISLDSFVDI